MCDYDELTVIMQCIFDPNLHPRPFIPNRLDLLDELLLQHVLIHALQRRQVQHAVHPILEAPRLPQVVHEVGLASFEDTLCERAGLGVHLLRQVGERVALLIPGDLPRGGHDVGRSGGFPGMLGR